MSGDSTSASGRRRGAGATVTVLAAAALTALAGCSGSSSGSSSASSASSRASSASLANPALDQSVKGCPTTGGTLTVDLDEQVLPDLDPSYTPQAAAYRVIRGVFDSLVYEGADGKFTPWLATSWTANSTDTSYTFTLRKGVTFSDGTPLNAAAVKYTFDRIESPAEGSEFAIALLGSYKDSVVNSPYSVTVNFTAPYPGFLEAASQAFLGIVSPTAAKKEGTTGFGQHPVGSGPFEITSNIANQSITEVRNPDYDWGPAGLNHQGPACLSKIVFTEVPTESTRAGQLEHGQVDAAETILPPDYTTVKDNTNLKLYVVPGAGADYQYEINTQQAPWNDTQLRIALRTLTDRRRVISHLAFSPDGRLLATGGPDGAVSLLEVASGERRRTLASHKKLLETWVEDVAFSPDGRLVAVGYEDATVRLWDPISGEHRRDLPGDEYFGCAMAFSPDGRLLAVGHGDGTVRLWDAASGDFRRALTGHTDGGAVAFSPDGALLATVGNADQALRLWDPASGEHWGTVHTSGGTDAAFSPDGRLLATAGRGVVRLWPLTRSALPELRAKQRRGLQGHPGSVFRSQGGAVPSAARGMTAAPAMGGRGDRRITRG